MSKSGEDGKNATVVSESGGGTFDILAISAMLGRLKHLKRTGWVHHQVGCSSFINSPNRGKGGLQSSSPSTKYRIYECPDFQVDSPETVACHMYRMSMLAQLLEGPLDRDRCVRMALVHDLGEAIVGDITPQCGVAERDKYEREKQVRGYGNGGFSRLKTLTKSHTHGFPVKWD